MQDWVFRMMIFGAVPPMQIIALVQSFLRRQHVRGVNVSSEFKPSLYPEQQEAEFLNLKSLCGDADVSVTVLGTTIT